MYSPEIHLMSHDLSLFLEGGGGLRKTTLSPFKDVTLRLGGGVKGNSVNVTLFPFYFFERRPLAIFMLIKIFLFAGFIFYFYRMGA